MNNQIIQKQAVSNVSSKTHQERVLETITTHQDKLIPVELSIWSSRTLAIKGTLGYRTLRALTEAFTVTLTEKFGLVVTDTERF